MLARTWNTTEVQKITNPLVTGEVRLRRGDDAVWCVTVHNRITLFEDRQTDRPYACDLLSTPKNVHVLNFDKVYLEISDILGVTQPILVVGYRRFGTTCPFRIQGCVWRLNPTSLMMDRRCCTETSVTNYQSTLRNTQKSRDPTDIVVEAWNHVRKN